MTPEQELLSQAAKTAFRLNGQFYDIGEHLSRPTGLTAATWQVLGVVLSQLVANHAVIVKWASPDKAFSGRQTSWYNKAWLSMCPTQRTSERNSYDPLEKVAKQSGASPRHTRPSHSDSPTSWASTNSAA